MRVLEARIRDALSVAALPVAQTTRFRDTTLGGVTTLRFGAKRIVGLVVALSGYLAHDASEHVPFMLLDSLEMIDGERLVELASYLKQYVPYLVMVLLPDHAAALADHETLPDREITDI
jgi:hypothetical protein